jgi:hypothetical protein
MDIESEEYLQESFWIMNLDGIGNHGADDRWVGKFIKTVTLQRGYVDYMRVIEAYKIDDH